MGHDSRLGGHDSRQVNPSSILGGHGSRQVGHSSMLGGHGSRQEDMIPGRKVKA